jgi:Tol biopolymer transport system component
MRRNLETGQETELYRRESSGVGFYGLSVSPDGGRLAFMANTEAPHRVLMTLSTEGGAPQELYRGDYEHPIPFASAWTKDGRYVLVLASEGRETRLWAIPAEGGEPRKLDVAMERILFPAVSPDGQRLMFTGVQTKNELWVVHNLFGETRAAK